MRIAITGVTGHLGQAMVRYLSTRNVDLYLVGHSVPDYMRADVVFHLAAPNQRDEQACVTFTYFNEDLVTWADKHSVPVINTATWWQHAGFEAELLFYTRTKDAQQVMFSGHTTLTLFSIYGDSLRSNRGFVPQLIEHLAGRGTVAAASTEPRDWVHVDDVCRAYMAAIDAPVDVYDVATYLPISPMRLAQAFTDEHIDVWPDDPSALCHYPNKRLTGWRSEIAVTQYIAQALRQEAAA
jgi:nucleoside-diphosphate-sugar epimerase